MHNEAPTGRAIARNTLSRRAEEFGAGTALVAAIASFQMGCAAQIRQTSAPQTPSSAPPPRAETRVDEQVNPASLMINQIIMNQDMADMLERKGDALKIDFARLKELSKLVRLFAAGTPPPLPEPEPKDSPAEPPSPMAMANEALAAVADGLTPDAVDAAVSQEVDQQLQLNRLESAYLKLMKAKKMLAEKKDLYSGAIRVLTPLLRSFDMLIEDAHKSNDPDAPLEVQKLELEEELLVDTIERLKRSLAGMDAGAAEAGLNTLPSLQGIHEVLRKQGWGKTIDSRRP